MDELFDVFEETPQATKNGVEATHPKKKKSRSKKDKGKKRKADSGLVKQEDAGNDDVEMADGEENSTGDEVAGDALEPTDGQSKRRKKESQAEPVSADAFQTAASREVAQVGGFGPAKDIAESLVLSHNIQHQVALPPDLDYEYVPLSEHKAPENPARSYPFKLDPFQSLSIASIQRGESVLVSAHTSAGKTVVAEYAIAQCLKNGQRIIYTSPIKALSNQKYRDFAAEFSDVGLMTGDVTINPTASCLVMTTEILRSMLYRGSEIIREVAWVVFDEIHYLRDKSRGVVWEETIILLPDKVRHVFLSATIPNAFQFAEWIAKIHSQACHVVYTDFRPTPLQNYFFPAGGNGIFLVVDEQGVFKESNFNNAMMMIEDGRGADPADPFAKQKGRGKNKRPSQGVSADDNADIAKIVRMILKKNFHPVIVFNFSKREIEALALKISGMNFNNDTEKALVKQVFDNATRSLTEEERELPQIAHLLPLLQKGIGIHHSGLLPLLKETIEILFQEGLIKVLFATETFSIGLNMPARTVVFTAVTKWDGTKTRSLTTSEYIQMSGRAGRRGLDDRGIVIMMVDGTVSREEAKEMVVGQQDRLNSAFHLGYNMILNLQRIDTFSPEYMLERCFYQFQNTAGVTGLEKDLMALQHERDAILIADESTVKEYSNLRGQIDTYTNDMVAVIHHPSYCLEFLQPGRLVHIKTPDGVDFDWGVVINFTKRREPARGQPAYPEAEQFFVDVALFVSTKSDTISPGHEPVGAIANGVIPQGGAEPTRVEIVPCLLTCIVSFGSIRVFLPEDAGKTGRAKIGHSVKEVHRRFPDGIPILDPIESMGITDESFKQLLRKIEVLESRLLTNPLHGSPLLPELWRKNKEKALLSDQIKEKKKAIAKSHSIQQLDELKSRMRVLRRLGFTNDAEVIQMKGRVACEISSTEGHELLLSELLFNGFFTELTPEVCASVLSVFIFDEKMSADPLKDVLDKPYREVIAQAKIIAKVSQESKIDTDEKAYLSTLKWELMETVFEWAKGRPFGEICKMTNAYEGSLIRLFRRLEELLRQMAQAGKVMGNEELTKKFEETLSKIKRGIVATQSLYL